MMSDRTADQAEAMADGEYASSTPVEALNEIIGLLHRLSAEERVRVLRSIYAFFDFSPMPHSGNGASKPSDNEIRSERPPFSSGSIITPKEFLLQKAPSTDVERIACLAYYLTHFQEEPFFKTLELAKLNTDAAMPKFSNTSYSTNNAVKLGYLVAGPNSTRQLSAAGEKFVEALPDREAARSALKTFRGRRSPPRKRKASTT